MSANNKIIELRDVSKRYGNKDVIKNLSLYVREGHILTLLGASGCGKTTILRLIAGIQDPDTGEIFLNGRMVVGKGVNVPPEKRRVGMVFQDYALFPHLNVFDNVGFGVRGDAAAKKRRVLELLEMVGLTGYEKQMPYLLSGGQQQRVALARALAPQPDILLLDEPFSNLDTGLRRQVRGEVRDILRANRTTAVFVTHDQEEALSLSDRIAVMFDGKLQQVDYPERLYNTPATPQIAEFMGEANFVPAQANGTRAQSPLGEVRLLGPMMGAVQLLIRPERIHIEAQGGSGAEARVLWREYYGRNQRIGVVLNDGTRLTISTDTQIAYSVGDTVRVSVFAPLTAFAAESFAASAH